MTAQIIFAAMLLIIGASAVLRTMFQPPRTPVIVVQTMPEPTEYQSSGMGCFIVLILAVIMFIILFQI